VNDGTYKGFTHILSAGISVSIDSLFGPPRKILYGNAYEPNYAGPIEPGEEADRPLAPPQPKPAEPSPTKPVEEKPPEPEKKPAPAKKEPEKRKEWWEGSE
jgi:hypothetical protein